MDNAIYGAAVEGAEYVANQNWLYFGLGFGAGIMFAVLLAAGAYFLMKKKGIIK